MEVDGTTHLNRYLQKVCTKCNGKDIEGNIRPESEGKGGSNNKVAAVDGYHKKHGPTDGEREDLRINRVADVRKGPTIDEPRLLPHLSSGTTVRSR